MESMKGVLRFRLDPAESARKRQILFNTALTQGHALALFEGVPGGPTLGHTLGLYASKGIPELVVVGYPLGGIEEMLERLVDLASQGLKIHDQTRLEGFFQTGDLAFVPVLPEWKQDYLPFAVDFYGGEGFPAFQAVWPDRRGLFPWNEGYSQELVHVQPLFDRKAYFRFLYPPELRVATTPEILGGHSTVLEVYHMGEGDWVFWDGNAEDGKAAIQAPLGELISLDAGLNALSILPQGTAALRKSPTHPWEFFHLPDPE